MNHNAMATMPANKLILSTGIPIMLSLALQAVYNIVDSIFVANMADVGEQAVNALTLAYPIQTLLVAATVGTGVGANVFISRSMGQGDHKDALLGVGNTIFLGWVITLVFFLFGLFGVETFIASQTSNELVISMGVDYLRICMLGCVGMSFFALYEKLLQATGRALYSTIALVTGAVTNLVLDPILIYGLFGFEAYGVKGAAYATVLGQIVAMVVGVTFHITKNKELHCSFHDIKPSLPIIKNIYAIGFPAIIAQALAAVMSYGINLIFIAAGESVVTVFGIYFKAQQFVSLAICGLRDAATPVISFAYGMRNKERIIQSMKSYFLYSTVIMIGGTILFLIFGGVLASLFGLSDTVEAMCATSLRITSLAFLFMGTSISTQGVLQGLERGLQSLLISFGRQLVFILPVAYLLTKVAVNNPSLTWVVWLTFLIGEGITCVISLYLLKRSYIKKVIPIS